MDKISRKFHLYNHRPWTFLSPILIGLFSGVLLYTLSMMFKFFNPWTGWRAALGNTTHFCELNRLEQLVLQPSNTWSNFGYLIVGLILISVGIKDHFFTERSKLKNLMARKPGFTILLGAALLYLFIGSFLYHASLTFFFQRIDVNGIYAIVMALFAYNLYKLFPSFKFRNKEVSTHGIFIGLAIFITFIFLTVLWRVNVNIMFPSLIGAFLIINILNIKKSKKHNNLFRYLQTSIFCMGLASFIWILDLRHIFCNPTSVLQGHALWHLLTALSVFFLYFYYRGETIVSGLDWSEVK